MPRDSRAGTYQEHSPTLSLATYAVGDQVGGVQTLARNNHKSGVILQSLVVVDRSRRNPSFDIYLFDTEPTLVSADNQPFDIADSEMLKCAGVVSIPRADYSQSVQSAVVGLRNIGLGMRATGPYVYAVVVAQNAILMPFPADAFTFRYHFELERV